MKTTENEMEYIVNGMRLSYKATGESSFGPDKLLLAEGKDLTASTPWKRDGYTIAKLFDDGAYHGFQQGIRKLLLKLWEETGISFKKDFPLDQYHTIVQTSQQHLACVDKTKLLPAQYLPLGKEKIEQRISDMLGVEVVALNPYDDQSIFHFRVIRPNSTDNNPLHRDVWLEDYESCINLYIPVAGSNEQSSLILIPGSHHWLESRIERTKAGAKINNVAFNVPAVTAINGEYDFMRPSPDDNEVLIFSPYLIHGGAVNLNPDQTRISIEMRLWKK